MKSEINLSQSNLIKEYFLNDFFIRLAKDYLNTDKITFIPSLFISNTNLESDNSLNIKKIRSKSAQNYHFDVDFKKFFKIFIYFTDVNEVDDGAHIYIEGTHKFKKKEHMITARFEDKDIEKNYKKTKIFLGHSGTVFFVDTFGLHKGSPVKGGKRILGIFEFGSGHFPWKKNSIYI